MGGLTEIRVSGQAEVVVRYPLLDSIVNMMKICPFEEWDPTPCAFLEPASISRDPKPGYLHVKKLDILQVVAMDLRSLCGIS